MSVYFLGPWLAEPLNSMKPVKDFLGKPAPAGYVAGAGRTGFTTRPDAAGEFNMQSRPDDVDDEGGLLHTASLDPEDLEADRVFSHIDAVMASRRRKKSDNVPKPAATGTVDVRNVFKDLRGTLQQVSAEEWAAIPEASDRTSKNKRTKKEAMLDRFTPLPDSVIMSSMGPGYTSSLDDGMGNSIDSIHMKDSQKNDPMEYLSKLSDQVINEDSLARAKLLVRGMLRSNPDNPASWIAAVRLELGAGRIRSARVLCKQAVDRIPDSPELWLEFAAIVEDRRAVLHEAISHSTENDGRWEEIWSMAIDTELTLPAKQVLLRKGLQKFPRSSKLWSLLIDLNTAKGDKISLLSRACEACPDHAKFWIALSETETADNSLKVLNTAIKRNPSNLDLWIQVLKRKHDNSIVQKAIEQCNLDIDSFPSIDDSPEVRLLVKALLTRIDDLYIYTKHNSPIIRQCAIEELFTTCESVEKRTELSKLHPELCSLALEKCHKTRELWILHLESDPSNALFEQALKVLPNDDHVWRMYSNYNPDDISLATKAYSLSKSPELAYRICLLFKNDSGYAEFLQQSVHLYPSYEPLLLLYSTAEATVLDSLKACPKSVHLWIRACLYSLNKSISAFRATWERAHKNINHELLWACLLRHGWHPSSAANALKECSHSGMLLWEIACHESNRAVRKAKALEALNVAGSDPNVQCLIGKLLLEEGREDGKEYLKRALENAGQYADVYARCFKYGGIEEAKVVFNLNKPKLSSIFMDRIDFTFDELVELV